MESTMSQAGDQFRSNEDDRCTAQTKDSRATLRSLLEDMESTMSRAGDQLRRIMEDLSTTQTKDFGAKLRSKVEDMVSMKSYGGDDFNLWITLVLLITNVAAQVYPVHPVDIPRAPRVVSSGETKKTWESSADMFLEELRLTNSSIRSIIEEQERNVQTVAEEIKAETQELQNDTDSLSDPQIWQTADFVQNMSEAIVEQQKGLSDNKASVKDTCREVKMSLKKVTDLVQRKWQSLSEEAKLKLDSLIRKLWKMIANMWKLIFCVLLQYELRDMFDSSKSASNISLSRGRLKYAFKLASMLALWLSHDVETNPGPQQFTDRSCVEMYVRLLSKAVKDHLKISGSIWSRETANAVYNSGFPRGVKWNNPSSGRNKDSLPKLKARAKELIRFLSDRNCLPSDLAAFTDLDQQEAMRRLRQYLEVENCKTAVDVLLNETYLTAPTTEALRHMKQLIEEKITQMTHTYPTRPKSASDINEFQQLADSQCLNDSVRHVTTLQRNEASIECPSSLSVLTAGVDPLMQETDNGELTNSVCTQSSAITDTQEGGGSTAVGSTRSDGVYRESNHNQENTKERSCAKGTDVSDTSQAECFITPDKILIEEGSIQFYSSHEGQRDTNTDRTDDEAFQDIIRLDPNTDATDDAYSTQLQSSPYEFMQGDDIHTPLTWPITEDVAVPSDTSDEALLADIESGPSCVFKAHDVNKSPDTCDIPDDVSQPTNTCTPCDALLADIEPVPSRVFNADDANTSADTCDIPDDVSHPTNTCTPCDALLADIESGPSRVFNADDVNTSPDTCDIPDDVSHPTNTCTPGDALLADIESGPSRVLNSTDINASHSHTPDADYSSYGETENDVPVADDGVSEDDTRNASEPQQDGNVSTDKNQLDTVCEGFYETPEHTYNTHDCERIFRTEACETKPEADTQTTETTENDTQTCVTMTETDTQTCVRTAETGAQASVTTAETDTQACVSIAETGAQACVTTTAADTQTCVTTAEIGTQTCLATAETNTQTHVTTAEEDTQTYITTTGTDTQTSGTTSETAQAPRSHGNDSHNRVDSDGSEMSPGRSDDTSKKRKHQLPHTPAKKRRT